NGTSAGSAITDGAGIATLSATSLAGINPGSYPGAVAASFAGDSGFTSSSGSNALTVSAADTSTAVTSSQNPAVSGQSVTFTATLSPVAPGTGAPSGTVTFLDNGSSLGTGTLSGGVATLIHQFGLNTSGVGSHTITTSYDGDGDFNASNGSLSGNPQLVN